jgi:hypothetical protein
MEQHSFAGQMQMQAIRQIITAQPKFIVFVSLETSWLTQPQSIVTILEWRFDYLEQNYVQIGVIDLLSQNNKYIWDADAAGYTPISGNYITVYRRK